VSDLGLTSDPARPGLVVVYGPILLLLLLLLAFVGRRTRTGDSAVSPDETPLALPVSAPRCFACCRERPETGRRGQRGDCAVPCLSQATRPGHNNRIGCLAGFDETVASAVGQVRAGKGTMHCCEGLEDNALSSSMMAPGWVLLGWYMETCAADRGARENIIKI
jgi:hypothetical protein